jgi:hypothetical protein
VEISLTCSETNILHCNPNSVLLCMPLVENVYENRPINSANHMLPAHVNLADLVGPTAPSLISSTIGHPLPQQLPSTLTMPDPTDHTGSLMYFRGILEAHEEDYQGAPVGDD